MPDGTLSLIPLSTLPDGERFLIENYALALTPGLALTDPQPVQRDNLDSLLVGLSKSVQDYSALPSVDEELADIGKSLNTDYREEPLRQALAGSNYRMLHIATHGESACRTAVGNERSALGLAGVAVKSGARSAIATLWFVDDEATMKAITEFYRQYQGNPDYSKVQALREAQLSLLEQSRYRHPAYWGPFLLIGNW